MRTRVIVLAVVLVGVGGGGVLGVRAWRASRVTLPPATEHAGAWGIGVRNAPDPPRMGENVLVVSLRDAAGRPVDRAQVSVRVSMPAMGQMAAMESRARVRESAPGVYRAAYSLSMPGEWDVDVSARTASGASGAAAYRLSTSLRGLTPVGETAAIGTAAAPATTTSPGTAVTIDNARRQAYGIRTAVVTVRALTSSVRVPGRIAFVDGAARDVMPLYGGVVRAVHVGAAGREVHAGDILCSVYSPELWATQNEMLDALHAGARDTMAAALARAARDRLRLLGVSPATIDAIARSGRARETIDLTAPLGGVVSETAVVAGASFDARQMLYRIAPLDPVWVVAGVPQDRTSDARIGAPAQVIIAETGARVSGRIVSLAPAVATDTRTLDARVTVANATHRLHPGMAVVVELSRSLAPRVVVPADAVVPTGERSVVFVDAGGGRLLARDVVLGERAGDDYVVVSGLTAGERVVTSGAFLVAAESRLRGGRP